MTEATDPAPRLLFVVNVSWFFVSHRLPLALAAKQHGYEVHVACALERECEVIREHGLELHEVRFTRSRIGIIDTLVSMVDLWRLYRKLRPAVIHHVTSKPVLFGTLIARMLRLSGIVNAIPGLGIVFVGGGPGNRVRQWMLIRMYRVCLSRRVGRLIFQNAENREVFLRNNICRDDQAYLIPGSGVDPEYFRPSIPKPDSGLVVLFASRMLFSKGASEFVAVAHGLRELHPEARFVLAGSIDEFNPDHIPEETLRAWSASENVSWIGHQKDMRAVLRETTVVCLPTRYGEGVPKILIEAASMAIPIVTTDVPGCNSIVENGRNGFLVPVGEQNSLNRAVSKLLADGELRRVMGLAGREIVKERFSLSRVIRETMEIYQSFDGRC